MVERIEAKVKDGLAQWEIRDPDYWPTEDERGLASDFVYGLLADDEFLRLVWQQYNETIARRLDAGECVDCGCGGGTHWGGCGTADHDEQDPT